jgi:hypothetical protein
MEKNIWGEKARGKGKKRLGGEGEGEREGYTTASVEN